MHKISPVDPNFCSDKINEITKSPGNLNHVLTSAVHKYAQEIEKLRSTALLIDDKCRLSKSFIDLVTQISQIETFLSSTEKVEAQLVSLIPVARDIYTSTEHAICLFEETKITERNHQIRQFISYYDSALDAVRLLDDPDMICRALNDYLSFIGDEWNNTPDNRDLLIVEHIESHRNCLSTVSDLVSEFEDLMKDLGFPIISSSAFDNTVSTAKWNDDDLRRFTMAFRRLDSIQLLHLNILLTTPLSDIVSLPMQIILQPLEKRFRYHFTGDRKTNRLDKPEWYMTQILQWIRDNDYLLTVMDRDFLNFTQSPGAAAAAVPMRVQFMRGLVTLLLDKLNSDLELIHTPSSRYAIKFELNTKTQNSSASSTMQPGPRTAQGELVNNLEYFGHLVDVILQTDARLTQLAYAPAEPRPSDVLAIPSMFGLWIRLEHQLALSRLDALLSSANAWTVLDDQHLQPQLADDFIALFHAVGLRGRQLTDRLARARFLRVQLHFCEVFFNRLIDCAYKSNEQSDHDQTSTVLNRANTGASTRISERLTSALGSILRTSTQLQKLPDLLRPGSAQSGLGPSGRWISVINGLAYLRDTLLELANDRFYVAFWEEQSVRHLLEISDPYLTDLGLDDRPVVELSENDTDKSSVASSWKRSPGAHAGVFSRLLVLYERGMERLLKETVQCVMHEVRMNASNYVRTSDHWLRPGWTSRHTGGVVMDAVGMIELSAAATSMLICLKDQLFQLNQTLQSKLFSEAWQRIAHDLDTFLYTHLILVNRFSPAGAAQLRFDVNHCLFPLFVLYTNRPETYFPQCRDALILLNLLRGTAELLRENLKEHLAGGQSDTANNPLAPLMELGVFSLSVEEAHAILGLRAIHD